MAVHDFSEMPKVVKSYTAAINKGMAVAVQKIATVTFHTIIDNTPVLTTRAVSNWITYTGANPKGRRMVPARFGGNAGRGAVMRGSAAKRMMKLEADAKIKTYSKPSQSLWLINRAPYIKLLEYGGPKNRPYGMVAKGLQAGRLRASSIQIIKEGKISGRGSRSS